MLKQSLATEEPEFLSLLNDNIEYYKPIYRMPKIEKNNSHKKINRDLFRPSKSNESVIVKYPLNLSSNSIKIHNLVLLIVISVSSTLQYGIFLKIYDLLIFYFSSINYTSKNIVLINNLYFFILLLSWKFQIYLIIYTIYAAIVYFFNRKIKSKDNNAKNGADLVNYSTPLLQKTPRNPNKDDFEGNPTFKFREFKYNYIKKNGYNYKNYFKIFLLTSNIFDRSNLTNIKSAIPSLTDEYFFSFNELLQGLIGFLFSFTIFFSANYYYFGIIYSIQELTSLLPYYIQLNQTKSIRDKKLSSNHGVNKLIKYLFPILILYTLRFLYNALENPKKLFILPIIIVICIICQIAKQKYFIITSHEDSPFNILFKTYLYYYYITTIIVIVFECILLRFNFFILFYWMHDIKLFLWCIVGFGILGAICYNIPLVFLRICLSNDIVIRLIKYLNLLIIDIIGVFLFRRYSISDSLDYILWISLYGIIMFLFEFHHKL